MELPIDHFRLLGVSPSANAEEVLRAFQLRLDRPPKQGFTYEVLAQRSELLRLSADLLSDPIERQSYELALIEGSSGLDLSSNREVAGLLLLWESNASFQAFKLAKKALQPPQAPALGSGRESDLTLIAALSCRDASIEEQSCRRYASGADLLQEGIQLLQRMGKLVEERKTLESDLENLLPYRILDLLSREKEDEKSHNEGLMLLEDFVNKRGGLEGKRNSEKIAGLNQSDFELFFLQIRKFLTAKEQSRIYINWYKRGSEDAGFLAAFALIASGFAYRKPDLLQEARKYLRNINAIGFDPMPLIGCLDLLLGDVKQAEARFRSSSDEKLKDWLDNYLCTDDDHDDPDWMFFVGEYLFREEKKYQEAIVYFLQAIILNFDHSKCYLRIGFCKDLLNKYQEAIDYYQKAIELNYEDPSLCIYEIGSCMCFLRKYEEAIDYYQKAIELNHKNPSLCKIMIKKMHYYIRNRI